MNIIEKVEYYGGVVDDITLLQNRFDLRRHLHHTSFLNLCALRLRLIGYLDNNQFPDEITFPPYDLSPLADKDIEFKYLVKMRTHEEINMSDEVIPHLVETQDP